MSLLNLLVTVLNRGGTKEKEPWERDNGWLISSSVKDIFFNVTPLQYVNTQNSDNILIGINDITFGVTPVYYKDMYALENIVIGITDISFLVTKV